MVQIGSLVLITLYLTLNSPTISKSNLRSEYKAILEAR